MMQLLKLDRNNTLKSYPKSRQTLHLRVNIYLINNLQNLTDLIYVRRANLLNILQIFFVHNVIHQDLNSIKIILGTVINKEYTKKSIA